MRTAQPTVCFRNRQQSLFTSVTLLSLCYLVLLYPSHHRQQDIWRYYSMPEDYVVQLHNRSQQIISSACKANSSQSKFSSLYSGKQPPGIPVFVQKGMIPRPGTTPYSPPLGFRDCEEQLQEVVEMLPQADLPKGVALGTCSRCVVVGNGGILRGSRLGAYIDQHNIVIRMNNGPVVGHENDVGWKTTLRITYPEGAPLSPQEYDPSSLLVMVTYKSTDLAWLKAMVRKEPMNLWQKMWFWQSVVESIPLESQNYRVLNLDIVREAALNLLGFPEPHDNHWRWKQVLPTLGVISIVTALYLCDEVNVAGFGYDMTRPDLPLHYYETVRMNAMNAQAVHNVNREKRFLASLVKANVVNDLTNGIRW
ncbi:ST3 beta-galactoside alpha-2,3-sialyltransferase 7 isoform X1 [Rhincodon typus]|uniref:ST3 beta-galactoside alpha-2,3-sialyltransferase 7 isoform X1 n=1 Tax=Rhincodon typus TaxID=259920 RepID=UPI00202E25E3|nr:ST3 beta-galactoside alpha-2,3-sialyltransferase 7 isoform X1 [Rhincodon typus]